MNIREGNLRMLELSAAMLRAGQPFCPMDEVVSFSEDFEVPLEEGYALLASARAGLDVENDPEDRELFEHWMKPSFHKSSTAQYLEDPYFKAVSLKNRELGCWCYARETIVPGELFSEGDMVLTKEKRVLPQIGFFTEPFSFLAVFEEERDWMSLAPNETVTLRRPIEEASGRVLTYGLGLGYYAFMTARKREVESVTVVERDKNAIRLFKEMILPCFEHPEKVRIEKDDALKYAAALKPDTYDCVFADIWRDVSDGLELYRKLKTFEKNAPGTKFSYWIGPSMDLYLDDSLWP